MIEMLERHGGVVDAITVGERGLIDRAARLLDEEASGRVPPGVVFPGESVAARMLDAAACVGQVEIVAAALPRIDWPRGDARWHWMLMRPLGRHTDADRARFVQCFCAILARSGPDAGAPNTLLHCVCGNWPRATMAPEDRLAFATALLDAGARTDFRDTLLESTPLGWACRWGRIELVELLLARGADPVESDAPAWATPLAWARRRPSAEIVALLTRAGGTP